MLVVGCVVGLLSLLFDVCCCLSVVRFSLFVDVVRRSVFARVVICYVLFVVSCFGLLFVVCHVLMCCCLLLLSGVDCCCLFVA